MHRLCHTLVHEARRGGRVIKTCVHAHLENRLDTATFLADQQSIRVLENHFTGSVGVVPEFVFQTLQQQRIDRAVGQEARHEEAGQAPRRLRQHQECIAHRGREEPLVTGEPILQSRAPRRGRDSARCVGTDIGAALLLRHAHAHQRALLVPRRCEPRVILTR